MPRLTSRDYKASRRASLDVGRYRQFLYGAGVGLVLASGAFMYVGARQHQAQAAAASAPPHPTVLAAASGDTPGAGSATYAYPDMLSKSQVPLPPSDRHAKRAAPATHRAQEAAR